MLQKNRTVEKQALLQEICNTDWECKEAYMQVNNSIYFKMPLPYDWSKQHGTGTPRRVISMPAAEIILEQWTSMWLMGWKSHKNVQQASIFPQSDDENHGSSASPSLPMHFLISPSPQPTCTRLLYWRLPNVSSQWKLGCWRQVTWPLGSRIKPLKRQRTDGQVGSEWPILLIFSSLKTAMENGDVFLF